MIKVQGIHKNYKDKQVLKGINLSVSQGQIVALLGPNGAGKTTCFYTIIGLVKPDSGSVYLGNTEITNLSLCKRAQMGISYLPQEPSIFRGLTVEENILAILEIIEDDHKKQIQLLEDLLAKFSITHLRSEKAIKLSGGERRRLEIARTLAMSPDFIFLDEPLAGIDPIAIQGMKELIHKLKNDGIGIVITDHNVREALDISDRIYVLNQGNIIVEGEKQDILNDKTVRQIYLGESFKL
ncbi:MAG: LPS export ABC transporter ATP-binding protein [Rickettsiales bacterium]|nr:LPS export ABC transporter ATP-binding protein [Rickettsiales bacterium]